MKNKLGFTLVELLAVILVIAIPQIMSTIESSRKSTIELTVKTIASSAEKEYTKRSVLGTLDQDNNPIGCTDVVKLSSRDYESCKTTFDNNNRAVVTLLGNGKFDKYKCSNNECNTYTPIDVFKEEILNGAYPRLDEGMIPVTIETNGTVKTVDPNTSAWYSYGDRNNDNVNEKEWANVVLVKETATEGVT